MGLLDSYRPICFYGGGAKVTQHNAKIQYLYSRQALSELTIERLTQRVGFELLTLSLFLGVSNRGFGFIEFNDVDAATDWMERVQVICFWSHVVFLIGLFRFFPPWSFSLEYFVFFLHGLSHWIISFFFPPRSFSLNYFVFFLHV